MGLCRIILAVSLASLTLPALSFAETITVPPVFVDPQRECVGDECSETPQPPIVCQGQNCLPPQDNPVVKCEGQNCMPSQVEECEGEDCTPVENAQ